MDWRTGYCALDIQTSAHGHTARAKISDKIYWEKPHKKVAQVNQLCSIRKTRSLDRESLANYRTAILRDDAISRVTESIEGLTK